MLSSFAVHSQLARLSAITMSCLSLNYLWSKKTPVQYTEEEELFYFPFDFDSVCCILHGLKQSGQATSICDVIMMTYLLTPNFRSGFSLNLRRAPAS